MFGPRVGCSIMASLIGPLGQGLWWEVIAISELWPHLLISTGAVIYKNPTTQSSLSSFPISRVRHLPLFSIQNPSIG